MCAQERGSGEIEIDESVPDGVTEGVEAGAAADVNDLTMVEIDGVWMGSWGVGDGEEGVDEETEREEGGGEAIGDDGGDEIESLHRPLVASFGLCWRIPNGQLYAVNGLVTFALTALT